MSFIDSQNRAPKVEVLPDFRSRVTVRLDVQYQLYKDAATFEAEVRLPWGTAHEDYPNCRLVGQPSSGQIENAYKNPNEPPPILQRIYEEIDEEDETQVGEPSVTFDEDGNLNVEINWVQFSSATAVNEVVGTTHAQAPYAAAILKDQIVTNDGTLRQIKRIYNGNRTLSDVSELRFGGKVIVRTITAIGVIPPTPAGYSLVGPGVLHPDGRQIYTYQFAAAAGGGTPGSSGQISIEYYNAQGGAVDFDPAAPAGSNGSTRAVIRYVTPLGTTGNPISTPAGFVLVGLEQMQDTGYILWSATYYRGQGLVVDESTVSESGALVVYHRVQFGSAPSAPAHTIGGTVTLFDTSQKNADGYVIYDYRWAEGNGQSDYTLEGDGDGSLIYTVVTFTAAPAVPAYPGSGTAYNTRLQQKTNAGYYTNIAVWRKPPVTVTFKQTTQFEKPGAAVFTGSPPQLVLTPPVTLTLLADMEVSYGTAQISDVPFTVEAPASFFESYTPTDTGIAVTDTQSLGRYLAGASSISGSASEYNGVLCDVWSATLVSSIPSSFSTGLKVLFTKNEIYLTDVGGVVVYRRTKVSYTF